MTDNTRIAEHGDAMATVTRLLDSAPAPRHGVTVRLAGRTVLFRSDLSAGVAVAHAILGSYCDVEQAPPEATAADRDWTVTSIRVPALVEALERLENEVTVTPAPVRRWAGDFPADRYDLAPGYAVVVHRRPFTGLTVFSLDGRQIWYLRPDAAFDVPHTEHVIKYPLRVVLREDGFAQVHAAGCAYRGRGLLFTGEKGRGKSTLLGQFMSHGARQISNDVAFARVATDGSPEIIAFPHMTRVADGTIQDNPKLRDGLARQARSGDYLESPVFNGGKEEFYYPVLESIWGKDPVCRRMALDLIIFPALDLGCRKTEVTPVDPAEKAARLRNSLINDPPYPDWLPFMTDTQFRGLAVSAAESLLRCAPPAYEVRFGSSRTNAVEAIAEILAEFRPGEPEVSALEHTTTGPN